MKKAYLIRHAQSQKADPSTADKERILTAKGRKEAGKMAKFLKGKIEHIDNIFTSPARRTYQTAAAFAFTFDEDEEFLRIHARLYLPKSQEDILDVIRENSREHDHILIVSHNPASTQLASQYSEEIRNVPPCGIVELTYKEESWYDFGMGNTYLTGFWYPKMFD